MHRTTSLTLLTDLYQLTMAQGHWILGRADREAVFHLFFRRAPFGGDHAIAAGLGTALEFLRDLRFTADDLDYLRTLRGNDDGPLFEPGFLAHLESFRLTCDLDAVPEGTLVFAHEPLLRVRGPILECQLLETALLNIVNFQTLVATKASRVCQAARGDPVLEFGLRRAQGIDGALSASRAAAVGGCAATSNVLAGKLFGIPVKGTHAHSWVMSFESEEDAFEGYARAMPNNCVFLVDTYDTIDGVRRAIEAGQRLRERGHEMVGIRLDSGDLAQLSIEARRLLDDAGFADAAIVASNDLDESSIDTLRRAGARIAVWGVGTKLVTAFDQPALGGVYKLGAMRAASGQWLPKLKLSEEPIKTSIPGILQVRRVEDAGGILADLIYDELTGLDERGLLVDLADPTVTRPIDAAATTRDLLVPAMRCGVVTLDPEPIEALRDRARAELASWIETRGRGALDPVGLDVGLAERRQTLMQEAMPA